MTKNDLKKAAKDVKSCPLHAVIQIAVLTVLYGMLAFQPALTCLSVLGDLIPDGDLRFED